MICADEDWPQERRYTEIPVDKLIKTAKPLIDKRNFTGDSDLDKHMLYSIIKRQFYKKREVCFPYVEESKKQKEKTFNLGTDSRRTAEGGSLPAKTWEAAKNQPRLPAIIYKRASELNGGVVMVIQQDIKNEIIQLGEKWEKIKRIEKDANNCLATFVLDYMKKHNYGKTSNELMEIIQYLPRGCLFEFRMWQEYHELLEKEEAAVDTSKEIDGMCSEETSEKQSVLEQIQAGLPLSSNYARRGRKAKSAERD